MFNGKIQDNVKKKIIKVFISLGQSIYFVITFFVERSFFFSHELAASVDSHR